MKMKINLKCQPDFTINTEKILILELVMCKTKINFKKNLIFSLTFYK